MSGGGEGELREKKEKKGCGVLWETDDSIHSRLASEGKGLWHFIVLGLPSDLHAHISEHLVIKRGNETRSRWI